MGYYAKPESQAQRVISWGLALGFGRRNDKSPALIHSISTANAYRSALTTFCRRIQKNRLGNLIQANVKTCFSFLEERAGQVGQKTLDRDRQAIQYLLTRTTRMEIRAATDQVYLLGWATPCKTVAGVYQAMAFILLKLDYEVLAQIR